MKVTTFLRWLAILVLLTLALGVLAQQTTPTSYHTYLPVVMRKAPATSDAKARVDRLSRSFTVTSAVVGGIVGSLIS